MGRSEKVLSVDVSKDGNLIASNQRSGSESRASCLVGPSTVSCGHTHPKLRRRSSMESSRTLRRTNNRRLNPGPEDHMVLVKKGIPNYIRAWDNSIKVLEYSQSSGYDVRVVRNGN
jgi:hypothetical protein